MPGCRAKIFVISLFLFSVVSCSVKQTIETGGSTYKYFDAVWICSNLSVPTDMFIDNNDNIYIIDAGLKAVMIFDKEMNSLGGWTDSSFYSPYGIAVNPNMDKVYVADTWNNRVVIYSVSGTLLTNLPGFTYVRDILVDSRDNIFALASDKLYKINSNYQTLTNTACPDCFGLVFDGFGNICTVGFGDLYRFRTNDLSSVDSFSAPWTGYFNTIAGGDLAITKDRTKFYKVNHYITYGTAYIDVYLTNGTFVTNMDVLGIDGFFLSANRALSFNSENKLYFIAADYDESYYRMFRFK